MHAHADVSMKAPAVPLPTLTTSSTVPPISFLPFIFFDYFIYLDTVYDYYIFPFDLYNAFKSKNGVDNDFIFY